MDTGCQPGTERIGRAAWNRCLSRAAGTVAPTEAIARDGTSNFLRGERFPAFSARPNRGTSAALVLSLADCGTVKDKGTYGRKLAAEGKLLARRSGRRQQVC